jgi:NAD(P)-dependent dehydrogenase (short-subunit alcohol dehydrogenase family)
MKEFIDKTAVITGAARGIGLALTREAVCRGMRVVMADWDAPALNTAADNLAAQGYAVYPVVTDVTKSSDLATLAQETVKQFGAPQLLCNNAGIGGVPGAIWELPLANIQRVLDINLMGIVHGLRAFVPLMLATGEESHIVNTSSMAGMYSAPYLSSYLMSKHAVAALTESLYHDLKQRQSRIAVSLLCPGFVKTNILQDRAHVNDINLENYSLEDVRWITNFAKSVTQGMETDAVAAAVFSAIMAKKFYVFTEPKMKQTIQARLQAILDEAAPTQLVF